MEQAQSEGSELAFGEGANAPAPSPPAGSTSVKQLEADEAQRVIPTRRKLGDEQERELTRLYADTTMPVSEISPACMASGSLPCTAWLSATEPRCGGDRRHLARRRRSRLQAVLAFAQELVRRRPWRNRQRRRRRQRWLALPPGCGRATPMPGKQRRLRH